MGIIITLNPMNIVIMAGGIGTRLWPMSREKKPKQFFPILSEKTLLEDTYNRFVSRFGVEKIYVATHHSFGAMVSQLLPILPADHLILEPERRDTAPSMGYASAILSAISPDEPAVFIPSDHYIGNIARFIECLEAGERQILKSGQMIDIGVIPGFPSTVLGYTKIGKATNCDGDIQFYKFLSHKEKPDFAKAKEYVEAGDYLWHASYYMWTPRKFLESYSLYNPEMNEILERIRDCLLAENTEKIAWLYSQMQKISFDYAITEKMNPDNVRIIKGDFGWSDIGAWDVLFSQLKLSDASPENNIVKNRCVLQDTRNTLVYGQEGKISAVLGVSDMIIVDTEDALLVCPQGKAQEVKKLIEEIRDKGWGGYL
ncbi:MAG: mannose-1-phosphate guanylyltransferase [Parcubacteria group bacterium Gr01-1014_18]|nr:MAG: mannose-1-phosphate guanylyltransferase [Parcubacteria group bacterium Greene0416_36]TSC79518.1 MAG: mannose-1-phosphate guanylyltransferase [Parcubacteria group bacterium Gr01-1014_18]TSC97994.1 MAG: mannose-1-phosphate guanylyltransferase [Parcubacteria group bacterium Greene1014_20]TSD06132.1 MAG: mannose-1-phosphate guanylyltransferase [Parcubacteria group bacterium Greene0714_2]